MNDIRPSPALSNPGNAGPRAAAHRCRTPLRTAALAAGVVACGPIAHAVAQRARGRMPTAVDVVVKDDLRSSAEPRSGSQFGIGVGAAWLPRHEGADSPIVQQRYVTGVSAAIGHRF